MSGASIGLGRLPLLREGVLTWGDRIGIALRWCGGTPYLWVVYHPVEGAKINGLAEGMRDIRLTGPAPAGLIRALSPSAAR